MYQLRPYQQQAVDAVIRYFRKRHEPALLVLPTGAGKSLVIAELARLAKGRVLVLAGQPLNEPIAQWGPFVMNTRDEIEQAIAEMRAGTLA